MKHVVFFLFISLLFPCCQSATEVRTKPQEVKTAKKKVSLTHLVRHPTSKSTNPPLLIILHGVGANERNLHEPLAQHFDPRLLVVSVRSPIELEPDSFGWYKVGFSETGVVIDAEEEDQGRLQFIKVIDEIVAYYEADPKKVFLLGFSQGAIMSAAVALSAPEKIKGAVLLSGKVPVVIDKSLANAAAIAKVDVYVSHGKRDKVLPITDGQALKQKLEKAGVRNLIYKEHEGAHQLDGGHLREVLQWLSVRL